VGLRAVATLIDLVLLSIIGYVLASSGGVSATGFNLGGAILRLADRLAGYYVVLEARFGWTLGKRPSACGS